MKNQKYYLNHENAGINLELIMKNKKDEDETMIIDY